MLQPTTLDDLIARLDIAESAKPGELTEAAIVAEGIQEVAPALA